MGLGFGGGFGKLDRGLKPIEENARRGVGAKGGHGEVCITIIVYTHLRSLLELYATSCRTIIYYHHHHLLYHIFFQSSSPYLIYPAGRRPLLEKHRWGRVGEGIITMACTRRSLLELYAAYPIFRIMPQIPAHIFQSLSTFSPPHGRRPLLGNHKPEAGETEAPAPPKEKKSKKRERDPGLAKDRKHSPRTLS